MGDTFNIIRCYLKMAYLAWCQCNIEFRRMLKSLSEKAISPILSSRIKFYLLQSILTKSWFSTLRGYPCSSQEKDLSRYIGALTPLLDDLNDEKGLDATSIFQFLNEKNSNPNIAQKLYEKIKNIGDKDFLHLLEKAMSAQDQSLAQLQEPKLSQEQLIRISRNKGGLFTLLFRKALKHPCSQEEKSMIMDLGFILQLCNDMFDVYKDLQNKQQTIFTQLEDFSVGEKLYKSSYEQFIAKLLDLNYSDKQKKLFLHEVNCIYARGLVCLDQLLQYQNEINPGLDFSNAERKHLICDMEKWSNIKGSIKHSIQLERSFNKKIKNYEKADIRSRGSYVN